MGTLKGGKTTGSTNPNDYNADGTPGTPDAQMVLLKAPKIQYEQLMLNTTFRQYLETILYSAKKITNRCSKNTLPKDLRITSRISRLYSRLSRCRQTI